MQPRSFLHSPPEGPSLSGRRLRKDYPVFVSYMTRFDAGKIQREAGIPASLIHRLREGSVRELSPATVDKFQVLYYSYWDSRLERNGFNLDEREKMIYYAPPKYMSDAVKQNIEVAARISKMRRVRDKACPKFNSKWHTRAETLRQMAFNNLYSADDWLKVVQQGSTKSKKSHHEPTKPLRRPPGRPRQFEH